MVEYNVNKQEAYARGDDEIINYMSQMFPTAKIVFLICWRDVRMIPDFLRPENWKPDPETDTMLRLIQEYEEHFGKGVTTEPAPYSTQEWIVILQKCITEDILVEELLMGELETPDLEDIEYIIIEE